MWWQTKKGAIIHMTQKIQQYYFIVVVAVTYIIQISYNICCSSHESPMNQELCAKEMCSKNKL